VSKNLNNSFSVQDLTKNNLNKNVINSIQEQNIEKINTHINKNIINSIHEKNIYHAQN